MQLWRGRHEVPADPRPSAVTVGKFDGVHLGHAAVIARLRAEAASRDLQSAVVTFDRNPLALLAPEKCPPDLTSPAQRSELLAATGLDAALELAFDRALSELEPRDFVEQVLVGDLATRLVLTGPDFRFGHRGAGDVPLLVELGRELGFEVLVVDEVVTHDDVEPGRRIGSSWIRELLAAGRVVDAEALLGRRHTVRATVVHGDHIGRELGYPTANLDRASEGMLPADGVYAAWADIDGERFGAAVSIGNNPTFDGVPQHQVEAHLFDVARDLYGRTLELRFVEHLRAMAKFDSVDDLVVALDEDAARIRSILAADAD